MPRSSDLTALLLEAAARADTTVTEQLVTAGFADLRPAQRPLLLHLRGGPRTVHDLAGRLAITAQGASKAVIELETAGYVRRRVDPSDRRSRVVELTGRGEAALEATDAARTLVSSSWRATLGDRGVAAFERSLRAIVG